ncbi:hypothetical protein WJX73_010454 [Symbiochloris irregularis]|uniref:Peptidyl-prolyl cis-trans isomerase n=1 Tax=Symbiochloris irregularis TaxID=706552 RepID=A0AAW1NM07_9CHLO
MALQLCDITCADKPGGLGFPEGGHNTSDRLPERLQQRKRRWFVKRNIAKLPTASALKASAPGSEGSGDTSARGATLLSKGRWHRRVLEALTRIQAGEKFDQVAQQCSEDKARQGGDLGWKTRQDVVGAFAEAAFKLNVGEMTTAPIKTQFGYHLILCEGRK